MGTGNLVVSASDGSPASMKSPVQNYLTRAEQLEASHPIVSHYCRVFALEKIVSLQPDHAVVLPLLTEIESKQKLIDLSRGREVMTTFALSSYNNANAVDREGPPSNAVYLTLYAASLYIDVLATFTSLQLDPKLMALKTYLQQRAIYIKQCLAAGASPDPADPPVASARLNTEAGRAALDAKREQVEAEAAAQAEEKRKEEHRLLAEQQANLLAQQQANLLAQQQEQQRLAAQQQEEQRLAAEEEQRRTAAQQLAAKQLAAQQLADQQEQQRRLLAQKAVATAVAPPDQVAPYWFGYSTTKKKMEAKKVTDKAAKCLDAGDGATAATLIREALGMLEGL